VRLEPLGQEARPRTEPEPPPHRRRRGLALVDLAVHAKDATEGSSIAAFVHGGSVTFKGVSLVAGKGAKGKDGKAGETGVPTPADLNGATPEAGGEAKGGAAKQCSCSSGGTTTGGRGGDTLGVNNNGQPGLPQITPPSPPTATGEGSTSVACQTENLNGKRGSDAPVAPDGKMAGLGDLGESGWVPGRGEPGSNGAPGQGGGGGGGNPSGGSPGAGGGGACGGCGGTGGTGGDGGGASIALVAHNSAVLLQESELVAANAGDGGDGKPGGDGQTGGSGGVRVGSCSGGPGGRGANGGSGAGGAGGVSVGVLYKGTTPTLDAATENAIAVGAKGAPGAGGADGNAGRDGDAKPVLEAP
jgi:hypothetical protein